MVGVKGFSIENHQDFIYIYDEKINYVIEIESIEYTKMINNKHYEIGLKSGNRIQLSFEVPDNILKFSKELLKYQSDYKNRSK